jgi:hypothetical protein
MGCLKIHINKIETSPLKVVYRKVETEPKVVQMWYQVDPKAEAMMGMIPYCAMNNNPVLNADPEGDLPFLAIVAIGAATGVFSNGLSNVSNGQDFFNGAGKAALWGGIGAAASFGVGAVFGATGSFGHELLRARVHGLTQGGISAAQGGNFWQGTLSGSIGSGISSGIDALGGTAGHQILGGGLGGGIGSAISGGNFWQGFGQGVAVGAFNHALHSGLSGGGEPPTNAEKKAMLEYWAGEMIAGRISPNQYLNVWYLAEGGSWALVKHVLFEHKTDIALSMIPGGKIVSPFKGVTAKFLVKNGIKDIHAFKEFHLGTNKGLKLFDVVKHTATGELLIIRKSTQNIVTNTGYFIK